MGCGAEVEANEVMTALLVGKTFDLPDVDLSSAEFQLPDLTLLNPPPALTNADLTTGQVGGSGTLDQILKSVSNHIAEQFEKNRITGSDFSKTYAALFQSAIGASVQYLLGKDQAYWQAVAAQMQARIAETQLVTTRVQLEIAKAELASKRYEALTNEAAYALTKMKLASESVAYCLAKFNLDELSPVQKMLLLEQYETARSQTLDTRSDGTTVVGTVGKQKDLYTQQIISYQRDAEVKAAKIFTDAWITMKTIDEGLLPPTKFANASIDTVLNALKTNNGLN